MKNFRKNIFFNVLFGSAITGGLYYLNYQFNLIKYIPYVTRSKTQLSDSDEDKLIEDQNKVCKLNKDHSKTNSISIAKSKKKIKHIWKLDSISED